jgi:hypothetical protein
LTKEFFVGGDDFVFQRLLKAFNFQLRRGIIETKLSGPRKITTDPAFLSEWFFFWFPKSTFYFPAVKTK